jgi:Arc/MetJ-type ribon-helix-helix transcriptional regulator
VKIHLFPEHEAFIREKVASGEYEAPDDVITAALDCFQ